MGQILITKGFIVIAETELVDMKDMGFNRVSIIRIDSVRVIKEWDIGMLCMKVFKKIETSVSVEHESIDDVMTVTGKCVGDAGVSGTEGLLKETAVVDETAGHDRVVERTIYSIQVGVDGFGYG